MKKILCLIDGLGSGGAQRQLVGLTELLQQRGYEVLLVWYCPKDFFRSYLCEHGIPHQFISARDKLSKLYGVYKVMRSFRPDYTIAFIDGPTMISCFLKMLGTRTKLIVSERNTTQKLNRHQRLKFFIYRWADFVVSNSQSQTDFINSHFCRLKNKTRTIRNFVDTDHFCPSNERSVNQDRLYLLVVARLARQKNVLRFMEAAKRVHDAGIPLYVRWYGNPSFGEKDYVEEIYKFYRKELLGYWFEFRPPTNDILKQYQACDVFCLPSLHEGFPNVICEAMSCGKPILCSAINDNPFLVRDGENGYLFNPMSIDDIASSIIRFSKLSRWEREKTGMNNRGIAEQRLSGESFVKKYIQLIEDNIYFR